MARIRSTIQTLVELHTGKSGKDTLIEALCDSALKLAVLRHPFKDSQSDPSDFAITAGDTSVDISSITGLAHIITARIVDADGSLNSPLVMKPVTWWDENVVNPEDNHRGRPTFGFRRGTNIILDRPCDSGRELRLRVATYQTFADDDTECPIEVLDIFVEHYVTAFVFLSVQEKEEFKFWYALALGSDYARNNKVGGDLLECINADKYEVADRLQMQRAGGPFVAREGGIAVRNLITGHEDYGNIRTWY